MNVWELLTECSFSRATQEFECFSQISSQQLWLESNGQTELGNSVQSLGVNLTSDGQQRFWNNFMLDECPKLPIVVQLCLHHCQMINSNRPSYRESILVRRESSCNLSHCRTPFELIQMVHVRSSYRISLVTSMITERSYELRRATDPT